MFRGLLQTINSVSKAQFLPLKRFFVTEKIRPKIFITAKLPQKGFEKLEQSCHIQDYWTSDQPLPRSHLLKLSSSVDGLLCVLSNKIDKELLSSSKRLKVVSTLSVGFDHIDLEECRRLGIKVGNTPGVLSEATADLVLTLMLATARRIPEAVNAVHEGTWPKSFLPTWMGGKDLHSSTVGIIGLGGIGSAVGRRLLGFGCDILYTGPNEKKQEAERLNAKYVTLDDLLKLSDFVVPLCPLNQNTYRMFNRDLFKKMKPDAIFINCSRGDIVDQEALLWAVSSSVIAAAGLDVTTPEPLPTDSPLLDPSLRGKLVIFPHIGSASIKTRENMALLAAENLIAGLSGRPMPSPL